MEVIKEYIELIAGGLSLLSSIVVFVVFFIKRRKDLKNAKTEEEQNAIINDIKSRVYGLVTTAESLFSEVPKSGVSKLAYVLEEVQKICENSNLIFNPGYWTDFINGIVKQSNDVIDEKTLERKKADIIEQIKKEVPFFITETDKIFANIPDGLTYKIEYVLKMIQSACEGFDVDVFTAFDWRGYVEGLYTVEKGA